jgi:hypothetical protein
VSKLDCLLCVKFMGLYVEDRGSKYHLARMESMEVSYSPLVLMLLHTILGKVLLKKGLVCLEGMLDLGSCRLALFRIFKSWLGV